MVELAENAVMPKGSEKRSDHAFVPGHYEQSSHEVKGRIEYRVRKRERWSDFIRQRAIGREPEREKRADCYVPSGGNCSDRLTANPAEIVKQLLENGKHETERPEKTEGESSRT